MWLWSTNLNVLDVDTTMLWVFVENFPDLTPSFISAKKPLESFPNFRLQISQAFDFSFPWTLSSLQAFSSSPQIFFKASSGTRFPISTYSLIFHTELIFAFAKNCDFVLSLLFLKREKICATWHRRNCCFELPICCLLLLRK